jgi:hypothetical protein
VHRLPFSSTIRAFHAAISGRFARMMRSSPVMVIEVLSSINRRYSTGVALSMIRSWKAPKALTGGEAGLEELELHDSLTNAVSLKLEKVKMGEP